MIIDGKSYSEDSLLMTKKIIEKMGVNPRLLIVSLGEPNKAEQVYVKRKISAASEVGISAFHLVIADTYSDEEAVTIIEDVQKHYDGVIVQLPAAEHFDADWIINAIDPVKDVDCLTDKNMGRLFKGSPLYLPATVAGVEELIKAESINVRGKNVAVIGRSNIVGRPMASFFEHKNATVTLFHSKSEHCIDSLERFDIIVSCTGKPGLFSSLDARSDAIVFDCGYSFVDGRQCGDFVPVNDIVSKDIRYTPTPSGTGPMTVAALMSNMILAYELQH